MSPPELKFSLFIFQLFDRKFLDAVLNEWQKTVMDLPAGFRQAFEMVIILLHNLLLTEFHYQDSDLSLYFRV